MRTSKSFEVLTVGRVMLIMMMLAVVAATGMLVVDAKPGKGPHFDTSITEFINERTCWTGEVCKTEFQTEFRCKCPRWYWCRSPGRYYHAYCSMSAYGHIWLQPGGLQPYDILEDFE